MWKQFQKGSLNNSTANSKKANKVRRAQGPLHHARLKRSSMKGRREDALALVAEEGRGRLRKAAGSRRTDPDPQISEWGNPHELEIHATICEYIAYGR